jgi:guanylate kinase
VLFDVDVKGGINIKKKFGEKSISLFIMPPSVEELENRLINRATDSIEKIRIRVDRAQEELKLADQFDAIIINENLDKAREEAVKIISGFINN